jgi:hypothetical protein
MGAHRSFSCEVEFLGGPADGLVVVVEYPPKTFLALQKVPGPQRGSLWRRLLQPFHRCEPSPSRVSIYELRYRTARICYWHLGTYVMSAAKVAATRQVISWA